MVDTGGYVRLRSRHDIHRDTRRRVRIHEEEAETTYAFRDANALTLAAAKAVCRDSRMPMRLGGGIVVTGRGEVVRCVNKQNVCVVSGPTRGPHTFAIWINIFCVAQSRFLRWTARLARRRARYCGGPGHGARTRAGDGASYQHSYSVGALGLHLAAAHLTHTAAFLFHDSGPSGAWQGALAEPATTLSTRQGELAIADSQAA